MLISVYLTPVRNPDDYYHQNIIADFVYDSVFPDPHTVGVFNSR